MSKMKIKKLLLIVFIVFSIQNIYAISEKTQKKIKHGLVALVALLGGGWLLKKYINTELNAEEKIKNNFQKNIDYVFSQIDPMGQVEERYLKFYKKDGELFYLVNTLSKQDVLIDSQALLKFEPEEFKKYFNRRVQN